MATVVLILVLLLLFAWLCNYNRSSCGGNCSGGGSSGSGGSSLLTFTLAARNKLATFTTWEE